MQSAQFFEYVRGISDEVPDGHNKAGCDLYRHLVYLGVEQMLADTHESVKDALAEEDWEALIRYFIKRARWSSNFYGDLDDEFDSFLAAEVVSGGDVCSTRLDEDQSRPQST